MRTIIRVRGVQLDVDSDAENILTVSEHKGEQDISVLLDPAVLPEIRELLFGDGKDQFGLPLPIFDVPTVRGGAL